MNILRLIFIVSVVTLFISCSAKEITSQTSSTKDKPENIGLGLPFRVDQVPTEMVPFGETINHPSPNGHPGIDFQWRNANTEIIVAMDGIVGDITKELSEIDNSIEVYHLVVVSGKYDISYEVLDLYDFNPNLEIDDEIIAGKVLGHPQPASTTDSGMM